MLQNVLSETPASLLTHPSILRSSTVSMILAPILTKKPTTNMMMINAKKGSQKPFTCTELESQCATSVLIFRAAAIPIKIPTNEKRATTRPFCMPFQIAIINRITTMLSSNI